MRFAVWIIFGICMGPVIGAVDKAENIYPVLSVIWAIQYVAVSAILIKRGII